MLRLPVFYNAWDRYDLDSVYKAMCSDDLSDCVLAALELVRQDDNFFRPLRLLKSTPESLAHIQQGKAFLVRSDFENALLAFNRALMHAPHNSEAMMLSYYNRSKLSMKLKQFSSCVKDIENCLTMECSNNIKEILTQNKLEASKLSLSENLIREQKYSEFADKFFEIKDKINQDIPCASSKISIISESQKPKVVAEADIPIGTLIALDDAFVSKCTKSNQCLTCHYCNTMSLSLIPCDGCCLALFCDEKCKENSIKEGHTVECKIMEVLFIQDIPCILPVKAMLKMHQMCQSWDELVSASQMLGLNRMKNSTISEIFGSDKFSTLNTYKNHHFVYGEMFKLCMYYAHVIRILELNTSFLPVSPECKNIAICAISRIMMHISLNATPIPTSHAASVPSIRATTMHNLPNYGYYPLISKLEHSCLPNVHIVGTQRGAALVTLMPIKKGDKILISYLHHWLEATEKENHQRQEKLFVMNKVICSCMICDRKELFVKPSLTGSQMEVFLKWLSDATVTSFRQDIAKVYEKTCHTLGLLSTAIYSKEFNEVFNKFRSIIMIVSIYKFPNVVMTL